MSIQTSGASLSGKHPTIANLYVDLVDETGQIILCHGTGAGDTTANTFQHGALYNRTDSGTGVVAVYQNTGSSASPVWTVMDTSLPGDTASSLIDTNSVTALDVGTTASAVNNLRVTDSAANRAPLLTSVGASASPGIEIYPKGSGVLSLGSQTAVGITSLQAINWVVGSGSSANAAVGTLVDANGVSIPLGSGLRILYKTDSTLQAGANTLDLNGFGTKAITTTSLNNLKTIVAAGAILDLVYDGTQFQCLNASNTMFS